MSGRQQSRRAAAIAPLVTAVAPIALVAVTARAEEEPRETAIERSAVAALPRIEVDRVEPPSDPPKSLRFLTENRDFIRAQIDQLRLLAKDGRDAVADSLDPRFLAFREMLAAIQAAADSQAAADAGLARRDLLASVADLAEIEAQIDSAEALLARQGDRLAWLERDFTGRQETAIVVLVRGVPACGAPDAIVIREANGDDVRVAFSPEAKAALAEGGIAEAVRAFVEPREHTFEISLEGPGCEAFPPATVLVETERDRLNFVELDLSAAKSPGAPLGVVAWVR
jgi:hypothetical protein